MRKTQKLFLEKAHIFTDHVALVQITTQTKVSQVSGCASQQRGGHVRLYQGVTHQGCSVTAMNNWRAGRSLPSMKTSACQVHLSPWHTHPSPSFPAVLAEDGHQVLLEKIEDWNVVELMVNGEVVFRCNIKDLEFGKSFPPAFCFL